jgi:hypothetical protein
MLPSHNGRSAVEIAIALEIVDKLIQRGSTHEARWVWDELGFPRDFYEFSKKYGTPDQCRRISATARRLEWVNPWPAGSYHPDGVCY